MRALARVAREVLCGEVHLARRNLEVLRAVRLGYDLNLEALVPAAGVLGLQPHFRARLQVQCEADDCDPFVAFAHHEHALAREAYTRRGLGCAEPDSRDAARDDRRARQRARPRARRPSARTERRGEALKEPAPVQRATCRPFATPLMVMTTIHLSS